jgi:riboflavin synthase
VNLERAMKLDRLDGHIVQGHVDQVGTCIQANVGAGFTLWIWCISKQFNHRKGSITVNGVSLTVVIQKNQFSVALYLYLWAYQL